MPKKSAANRGTALEEPQKLEDIDLDPIFPLPTIGKYPGVKHGEGEEILANTKLMVVEMPYRVFFALFEHAERRAAVEYPKYKDRTDGMENYAQSQVEAVAAFRSAFVGEIVPILSKDLVQKVREAKAKKAKKAVPTKAPTDDPHPKEPTDCPKCGPNRTVLKRKKDGVRVWRCADCGHRWPRSVLALAPGSPSKGRGGPKSGSNGSKAQSEPERPRKRPHK